MNKAATYIIVWGLLVSATLLEILIFTTSWIIEFKIAGILSLAIAQALTNAAFFQSLRYEKKMLSFLPLMSLIGLQTLVLTAILSVGR
jgi:hypothetical protein